MPPLRPALRAVSLRSRTRTLITTAPFLHPDAPPQSVPLNDRANDTAEKYRAYMIRKPLNPHLTNTSSTIANAFPSLGVDKPPADMLTSSDSTGAQEFTPKDSVPENTERMTGGTQPGAPPAREGGKDGGNAELDVGEISGGKFRVEPLKRQGEEEETLRARLIYQSRKRGTLESDLLLSTFAGAYLHRLSPPQLRAYDSFLDENDWDIYYWATQQPSPTSLETAEGSSSDLATETAAGAPSSPTASETPASSEELKRTQNIPGEWKNVAGSFKPAYRPVPQRWRNSEILALLRKHVLDRSAGGVAYEVGAGDATRTSSSGKGKLEAGESRRSITGTGGGGLGMMPELEVYRGSGSDSRSSR